MWVNISSSGNCLQLINSLLHKILIIKNNNKIAEDRLNQILENESIDYRLV